MIMCVCSFCTVRTEAARWEKPKRRLYVAISFFKHLLMNFSVTSWMKVQGSRFASQANSEPCSSRIKNSSNNRAVLRRVADREPRSAWCSYRKHFLQCRRHQEEEHFWSSLVLLINEIDSCSARPHCIVPLRHHAKNTGSSWRMDTGLHVGAATTMNVEAIESSAGSCGCCLISSARDLCGLEGNNVWINLSFKDVIYLVTADLLLSYRSYSLAFCVFEPRSCNSAERQTGKRWICDNRARRGVSLPVLTAKRRCGFCQKVSKI